MRRAFFAYFTVLLILMALPFFVFGQSIGDSIGSGSGPVKNYCRQLVPCGPGTGSQCTLCDFFTMVKNIFNCVLFGIVPVVAVLLIAGAGFFMIIAYAEGGEAGSGNLGKAKKIISSVLAGLLIIYGSWLVVDLFFKVIGLATQGQWNIINCQ